jgi:hypothetical protein
MIDFCLAEWLLTELASETCALEGKRLFRAESIPRVGLVWVYCRIAETTELVVPCLPLFLPPSYRSYTRMSWQRGMVPRCSLIESS